MAEKEPYIKVTKCGPYLVYGVKEIAEKIILVDDKGTSIEYGDGEKFEIKEDPVALCRCGQSKKAPFCDGTHAVEEFIGNETASFEPILANADEIEGPNLTLRDNPRYCAFARFCDANGQVWNLVKVGENTTDEEATRQSQYCPSGRLLMFNEAGEALESKLNPSIGVIEDDGLKISGPLWIRGGIRVESADGKNYEVRNRQTLCRCGRSGNKPFCNGLHARIKFKAKKG